MCYIVLPDVTTSLFESVRFKSIQIDSNRFMLSLHIDPPDAHHVYLRQAMAAPRPLGVALVLLVLAQARRGSIKGVPSEGDPFRGSLKGILKGNPIQKDLREWRLFFWSPLRRRNNHFGQHPTIGELHQGSGSFSGNFCSRDSFDLGCFDSSFCFLLSLSVFLLLCSGSSTCLQYFALRFSHVFFFSLFLLLCSFILACSPFSTECRIVQKQSE